MHPCAMHARHRELSRQPRQGETWNKHEASLNNTLESLSLRAAYPNVLWTKLADSLQHQLVTDLLAHGQDVDYIDASARRAGTMVSRRRSRALTSSNSITGPRKTHHISAEPLGLGT